MTHGTVHAPLNLQLNYIAMHPIFCVGMLRCTLEVCEENAIPTGRSKNLLALDAAKSTRVSSAAKTTDVLGGVSTLIDAM